MIYTRAGTPRSAFLELFSAFDHPLIVSSQTLQHIGSPCIFFLALDAVSDTCCCSNSNALLFPLRSVFSSLGGRGARLVHVHARLGAASTGPSPAPEGPGLKLATVTPFCHVSRALAFVQPQQSSLVPPEPPSVAERRPQGGFNELRFNGLIGSLWGSRCGEL